MRRYFSILAVAMATIFLSACELEGSNYQGQYYAEKLIWNRVLDGLEVEHEYMLPVVHLSEKLLGNETYKTSYDRPSGYSDKEGEDGYVLVYGYSEYSKKYYSIITDGKRLDEGAQWELYAWEERNVSSKQYVGTVTGIAGQTNMFRFSTGNPAWNRYSFYVAQESEVEYLFNGGTGYYDLKMVSVSGVNTDYLNDVASSDYTIEYESLRPMVFERGQLISGKMNLLYKDHVRQSERSVGVEISNRIVTYSEIK